MEWYEEKIKIDCTRNGEVYVYLYKYIKMILVI